MTKRKMLDVPRYTTRNVAEQIGLELQLALWTALDHRAEQGQELDYLQVFELSVEWVDGEQLQKVINRQEQPQHEVSFYVNGVETPIDGVTLWLIDSGEYCTLLFPQEY
ncbi:DUF960 domain-containing protein [Brevibacillus borstelensis]|uniref:DUF960 family protein n=1 Tax=Brevibacillus borstelensis TaxID=45462 RepID=UPI00203C9EFD|nr:DUF960 family protein [Brevibacillus borstelensis]MCM3625511.1 DUF960 domain-containing protein [Brevibacillus borstelensis]